MNKLSPAKRAQVVAALVEGTQHPRHGPHDRRGEEHRHEAPGRAGTACEKFRRETVVGVHAKRIQCDEIWFFVYGKERNAKPEMRAAGTAGDVWTWTALDADSKLMVSWLIGHRDAGYAHAFVEDVAHRLANRVQLTTDGNKLYLTAVEDALTWTTRSL